MSSIKIIQSYFAFCSFLGGYHMQIENSIDPIVIDLSTRRHSLLVFLPVVSFTTFELLFKLLTKCRIFNMMKRHLTCNKRKLQLEDILKCNL